MTTMTIDEPAPMPSAREAERAFLARDADYDGIFFAAVKTTGIFCRPSCPAKKPRRENVEFFPSPAGALHAGYRACLRCRPLDARGEPPAWVAELVAAIDADPEVRLRAADLRARGIDPGRASRWFVAHWGLTFAAYCRARRLGRAMQALRQGDKLDDVALGSGWGSLSGFRDAFGRAFGAPPGKSRGAEPAVARLVDSPLGPLVVAAVDAGVCLLEFTDRRMLETQLATLGRRLRLPLVPGRHAHLDRLARELDEYFAGLRRAFSVPLVTPGTPFQESVWAELRRIPYGETISYKELARRIGKPGACRAVGTANGSNRVAIVIPCHRVVNDDGRLGGYGGKLWRKKRLLALEGAQILD